MSGSNSLKEVFQTTLRIILVAKPRYKLLVLCGLFTALASAFQLTGLTMLIPILNGLVDPNRYEALLKTPQAGYYLKLIPFEFDNRTLFAGFIGIVLVSVYLENLFLYLGQSNSARLATDIAHGMRVKIFGSYLSFSKAFYDRQPLGELNVILTTFVTTVAQHIHHISMWFVVTCFSVAFLIMMLIISWELTAFSLILLPLTHIVAKKMSGRLNVSARGEIDEMVMLSDRSLNVLENISLVQLAAQEQQEQERFAEISETIRGHSLATRCRVFATPRIVEVINTSGIVILLIGTALLYFKHEALSIGRLSAFFISLRRLTSHIELFVSYWTQCYSNLPALKKVLTAFEETDNSAIPDGTENFAGIANSVSFNNVSFAYAPGTDQLKGISFSVTPGTMTAIVGPTGSGKTTLVSLIPRFYDCAAGSIEIDGVDLRRFRLSDYRRRVAVVTQQALVFCDTLRGNLTYGLRPEEFSEAELAQAVEKAQLADFVAGLDNGFETTIGGKGMQLSGGELQRIAIARAILRNPEILILDEPTSALDAETEQKIHRALEHLIANRTVFVVAHRMATVRRADLVIVLERGRIVEQGHPEALSLLGGTFQRYCELQGMSPLLGK